MSSDVCVFLPCWHDSGVPLAPSHQLFESLFGHEEESWEEDGPGSHEAPHGNTRLRRVCVCVALLSRSRGCGRLGEHGLVGVVWGRSLLLPPVRGVLMGEDLQEAGFLQVTRVIWLFANQCEVRATLCSQVLTSRNVLVICSEWLGQENTFQIKSQGWVWPTTCVGEWAPPTVTCS